MRPRQVGYQAALRPDRCCLLDSKALLHSLHPHPAGAPKPQRTAIRAQLASKLKPWNLFYLIRRIYFSQRGLHVKQTPRLNVLVC
jgi:hypothetical protein